ncbi:hypothetical protein HRbin02_01202 [Candidatus Calditenuaceae archaeon HR02]|nr:hypothetical protein HRbin02_01202 [Candidatus Calditenuaceae archaeon HR02]
MALKPSMLGLSRKAKRRELIRIVESASSIGFDVIVLDSERAVDDLQPVDVEAVAKFSEEIGGPAIVPTVPVRRGDFNSLLPGYLEILSRRDSMGLCIVAGNPAYLSADEASVRPGRLLWSACMAAEKVLNGRLMLLGTENVEKVSRQICGSISCIPFLLLDEGVEEVRRFADSPKRGVAVYAPFYIGDGVVGEAERVLVSYARRRKRLVEALGGGSLGLREALRVSIVGSVGEAAERVACLVSSGVRLLIGFPAKLSTTQLERLALATRKGWGKG